jgi:acetyltransferase-like isoleucine patch superfamily enzyme
MILKIALVFKLQGMDLFRRISRSVYWKLRLSKAEIGKLTKISFPLMLEGTGLLHIGDEVRIDRNVNLAIVEKGRIELGEKARLHEGVNLVAGAGGTIVLDESSCVLANSIIRNGSRLTLGKNSVIASDCRLFPREEGYDGAITIGEGTHIGDGTIIDTCADVNIGNLVAIGPNCIFYTHDHDYKTGLAAAWKGEVKTGNIMIGHGAWIGARVTILPGVTIGEKAVVAAGSIVTKDVLPGTIVGGIPAKPLKKSA